MNLTSVSKMHSVKLVLKEEIANSTASWKFKYCTLRIGKKFKQKISGIIKCLNTMATQPENRILYSATSEHMFFS